MSSTIGRAAAALAALVPEQHQYQTIATEGQENLEDQNDATIRPPPSPVRSWAVRGLVIAILTIAVVFFGSWVFVDRVPKSCDSVSTGFYCQPDISHFWGQYSPYFAVPSAIDPHTPPGCKIIFAQVLSRHGARDPTAGKSMAYRAMFESIHQNALSYNGRAAFLEKYKYRLGADQLTEFGRKEMANSGTGFYQRYKELVGAKEKPFVRASGQQRVVDSAVEWLHGFEAAQKHDGDKSPPSDDSSNDFVIIPETPTSNNTLSHDTCPSYTSLPGHRAQVAFANLFTPDITFRLNFLLPGANLSLSDTINLMDLCPYETVASPYGTLSPFCALFSVPEWRDYDYYQSLGKYYGFGDGNPLGAIQGAGFVNELVARMTGTKVVDHTNTNSTLDGREETFPLGRRLYADFSHDNDMVNVYAALGLYNATEPLGTGRRHKAEESGGFAASWTVPFGGRAYVEKMVCEGVEGELVRVLVNERVVGLEGCGGDELGRCTLDRFVESLSFAREDGLWDKCFL